jgi:tetratricopeptide (TPR) repeat protein
MACQSAPARTTTPAGACGTLLPQPSRREVGPALVLLLALAAASIPALAESGASDFPRFGAHVMLEPHTSSLITAYYESFLRDQDLESFRQRVSVRYTEGTLGRLVDSGTTQSRRAAVFALGLFGSYAANATVARALRDNDPVVRDLANNALWAIWFRADTTENNEALRQVSDLNGRRQFAAAVELATRLLAQAPQFAEAYNQRAIAHFFLGHFEESAADCRRTLLQNPYHFGALEGLARCQIQLDRRQDALKTLRRALRLQPYSEVIRQSMTILEAQE